MAAIYGTGADVMADSAEQRCVPRRGSVGARGPRRDGDGPPTDPWFWGGVTVVIGGLVVLAFVLLYGWLVAAIGGRG